jgi:hypothetical protein
MTPLNLRFSQDHAADEIVTVSMNRQYQSGVKQRFGSSQKRVPLAAAISGSTRSNLHKKRETNASRH